MNGLMTRVITAIVFVIVMLAGLYTNSYTYAILFTIISAACLWEYFIMTLPMTDPYNGKRKIWGMLIGMLPYLITLSYQLKLFGASSSSIWIASLLFMPLLFFIFIYELSTRSEKPFEHIGAILLGFIYIGIPFAMLNFIAFYENSYHPNIILVMLLLTWTNDTAAYLIGSQIGKTPLLPRISPKKTWEGTTGGIVFTFVVALVLSIWPIFGLERLQFIILAAIIILFGSIGDLVESMLKRSSKVKDTGSLLPGHGGLLDRFDAFIFLIPFAAAYLLWIR